MPNSATVLYKHPGLWMMTCWPIRAPSSVKRSFTASNQQNFDECSSIGFTGVKIKVQLSRRTNYQRHFWFSGIIQIPPIAEFILSTIVYM